jgi:hypothetical protein
MARYLAHSDPRFFLFFLERGAEGGEKLMDLLGVIFLSDLPAQIPDGRVMNSGQAGNPS